MALVEATRSLSQDPANWSAHRFLSDTYARLPRHEIARASELLQAQLLQPININPVQPSLPITDLNVISGVGPAEGAFNEFHPLFERNQAQLTATGVVGNNDTLGDEIVASGIWNRFSFSAGQFHSETDGFRDNNDLQNDLYNAYLQVAVGPRFGLQAEYRRRETEHGDLTINFDPSIFDSRRRSDLRQDTGRIGVHAAPSEQSDVLLSLFYRDETETLVQAQPTVDVDVRSTERGYQLEMQYLLREAFFNITVGTGLYDIDVDRTASFDFTRSLGTACPFVSCDIPSDFDRQQHNAYVYGNVAFPSNLVWTVGFSIDDVDQGEVDVDEFNPKIGLQWNLTEDSRIRIAWFRTVKRPLIIEQTLEPTQIAGFNQFFDDFNGSKTTRYGLGFDTYIFNSIYGGFELSRRDLDILTFDPQSLTATKNNAEEHLARVYIYTTFVDMLSLSAELQFEDFTQDVESGSNEPRHLETMIIPLAARCFDTAGLFGELRATYVRQDVKRRGATELEGDDSFVVLDAAIGYRLPKSRGIASLEIQNLLDENFNFQDADFRTSETRTSPFVPTRSLIGRFTLTF